MFAINANLWEIQEQRHRRNWTFALQRARDALLYTNLYFQRLKGGILSLEEEVRRQAHGEGDLSHGVLSK